MSKKTIQLVALLGVLVLLLAGYLLITSLSDDGGTTTDDGSLDADTTHTVCTVDQSTVHKIAYTYGGIEYTYHLKEDATGWVWTEDAALPLDNTYFALMVTACTDLTSTVRLTDVTAAQLVDYGLAEGGDTVHFTDDVNGAQTFRIGMRNSYNSLVYFCSETDLTTVYMVDATVPAAFCHTPYDMLKKPDLPTDITASNLVSVTLTPPEEGGKSPLIYTYYVGGKVEGETDVWYAAPAVGAEEVRLSDENGSALSTALTTIAFSEIVSYRAEEQAALGLDAPWVMTIDYKITNSFEDSTTGKVTKVDVPASFTLLLGDVSESGLCYAAVEDSPLTCTLMGEIFAKLRDGSLIPGQ